jgi:hypothetical protein
MPLGKDAHEKRLRDRGIYTEAQMEYTLKRSDMYQEYNQEHPGFFDMMINSGMSWLLIDIMFTGLSCTPSI